MICRKIVVRLLDTDITCVRYAGRPSKITKSIPIQA